MDNSWIRQLPNIPLKKVYSQFGEEPLYDYIFKNIGVTNRFLVDFGAGGLGASMSNSKYLLERGWTGLRMDGAPDPESDIKQEFITSENICALFEKYDVPKVFDFLSIDIDGNDVHVLEGILLGGYRPRLIVNEFNGCIPVGVNKVMKYDAKKVWEENDYYGGSFEAFKLLGHHHGYSLIHEVATTNMYFLSDELVGGSKDFGVKYTPMQYHAHSPNRAWEEYVPREKLNLV